MDKTTIERNLEVAVRKYAETGNIAWLNQINKPQSKLGE